MPGNHSLLWLSTKTAVLRLKTKKSFFYLKKLFVHKRAGTMFSERTDQFQTNYSHEHRVWDMLRENMILITLGPSSRGQQGVLAWCQHCVNWLTKPTMMGLLCELSLKYIRERMSNFFQIKRVTLVTKLGVSNQTVTTRVKRKRKGSGRTSRACWHWTAGDKPTSLTVTCPAVRFLRHVSVSETSLLLSLFPLAQMY